MPKQRVSTLVPRDADLPPAKQVQYFISFYVNTRDLKEAACKARLDPSMGERLYAEPKVREMIDRKLHMIDMEEAKLTASKRLLTVDLLDSSLVEEVRSKKNGHVRVRAIELGYKRTGMIRDGEFVGIQSGGPSAAGGRTYGQITTTMRRTTTEELVHSSEAPAQSMSSGTFTAHLLEPIQEY